VTASITSGDEPLVAVVCEVPLLAEALTSSLDGIAQIRVFPADVDDLDGLLRSLEPDAVVVDGAEQADASEVFARDAGVPLVHVRIRERELRILTAGGAWQSEDGGAGASPEAIRNVLVGALFGRQHA
jgi:hypothetical protein